MLYKDRAPVLQKFTTLLGFHKLRHSKIPSWVKSNNIDEMQKYCDELNEDMGFLFTLGKKLTPDLLRPNPHMKEFYKQCLNKYIGFFSLNEDKKSRIIFLDIHEVAKLKTHVEKKEVRWICPVNDRYIQVTLGAPVKKKTKSPYDHMDDTLSSVADRSVCLSSNAVIGALVRFVCALICGRVYSLRTCF
jgi:hypothetical protein